MRGSPVSSMIPSEWMYVPCLSPDPKLHSPQGGSRLRRSGRCLGRVPLPGDDGVPAVVEQLVDRVGSEVGGGNAGRQARRHLHPPGGRVAVRGDLEHLQRVERTELGPTERPRHPHEEHAVAVERVDDLGRELARLVGVLLVLIEQRQHRHRPLGQIGVGLERVGLSVTPARYVSRRLSVRPMASAPTRPCRPGPCRRPTPT